MIDIKFKTTKTYTLQVQIICIICTQYYTHLFNFFYNFYLHNSFFYCRNNFINISSG